MDKAVPMAALARQRGVLVGGATGYTHRGWLFIQYLWVSDELRGRGLGAHLLGRAETSARERGCRAVWLDTFSFQAPGFYEKLGYRQFGQLDEFPPGHARHFVWKPLEEG
jgi:GNAT superfamily N-acetyltransferase